MERSILRAGLCAVAFVLLIGSAVSWAQSPALIIPAFPENCSVAVGSGDQKVLEPFSAGTLRLLLVPCPELDAVRANPRHQVRQQTTLTSTSGLPIPKTQPSLNASSGAAPGLALSLDPATLGSRIDRAFGRMPPEKSVLVGYAEHDAFGNYRVSVSQGGGRETRAVLILSNLALKDGWHVLATMSRRVDAGTVLALLDQQRAMAQALHEANR